MDAQEGKGFPVLLDAVRRWRAMPEHRRGDYEDFIARHYWREAQLAGGLVVSLASGDPLTEDELMRTDLYELAIMYDDGTYSKVWAELKPEKDSEYQTALYRKAKEWRLANCVPTPESPHMYRSDRPCGVCGTHVRSIATNVCRECDHNRATSRSALL